VRGLVINRFANAGLWTAGSDNSVIEGNFIGTDVTGTVALGNGNYGVLFQGAPGNLIGGTAAGAGNVICATDTGVGIYGIGATVVGTSMAGPINRVTTKNHAGAEPSP
jgi:hypothetical protein